MPALDAGVVLVLLIFGVTCVVTMAHAACCNGGQMVVSPAIAAAMEAARHRRGAHAMAQHSNPHLPAKT